MGCVVLLILVPFVLAISATITGCLVYAGWNWGVLAAFPASNLGLLSFWQAVCVGLLISVVGGAFRFRVKARRK